MSDASIIRLETARRERQENAPSAETSFAGSLERRSSGTGKPVCGITFESISSFPKEDVYTSLSGAQYHQPTLKKWLQKYDVMPHNNLPSPEDVLCLWPASIGSAAETLVRRRQLNNDAGDAAAWHLNAFLCAGCSFFFTAVTSAGFVSDGASSIRRSGSHVIDFLRLAALLGVGLVSVRVAIRANQDRERAIRLLISLERTARPMSDEEIKKADLGIDYYTQKSV